MLVFFDVLYIDDQNLLDATYDTRRAKLEAVIHCVPGFTMLAEREKIELGVGDPVARLRDVFAQRIADFEGELPLYMRREKIVADACFVVQRV